MPKDVVRAAISEGKLSQSQLIWSPDENRWKQAKEIPELLPIEHLILHVKGTESETRQVPKPAVRAAISEGKITHSQLIWSTKENAWKQVRELPDLLPSQKLAPAVAPAARASSGTPEARVAAANGAAIPQARAASASAGAPKPTVASGPIPRVRASGPLAVKAQAGNPTPAVSVRAQAPILVRTTGDLVVKEDDHFHPFKWLFIILGLVIAVVVGINYFLVDAPLRSNLASTSFSNVMVHGHLGAFMQPNVMVIHIPPSSALTEENIPDFFAALAKSTPENPLTHDTYDRIAVTSNWTAEYSFSGYNWKQLGEGDHDTADQRKEALMDGMAYGNGQSVLPPSTMSEALQKTRRDKVWKDFVAKFCKP
jgi:hypothetical protein